MLRSGQCPTPINFHSRNLSRLTRRHALNSGLDLSLGMLAPDALPSPMDTHAGSTDSLVSLRANWRA